MTLFSYNNFLNDEELNDIHRIINESKWSYSGSDLFLNRDDIAAVTLWNMPLDHHVEWKEYMKKKIEDVSRKKFTLLKCYAVGQTKDLDGVFHTDDTREGSYTFLMYVNDIGDTETIPSVYIGGETEIISRDGKLFKSSPDLKKGILFDARLLHRGRAPIQRNKLRISVVFKLKEVKTFNHV